MADDYTVATTAPYRPTVRAEQLATTAMRTSVMSKSQIIAPFSLLPGAANASAIQSEVARFCGLKEVSSVEDVFPCTAFQQDLLAQTLKQPGEYINEIVFALNAEVNIPRFVAAWEDVIASTPILRTRIVDLPSCGLVQAVLVEGGRWSNEDDNAQMGLGTSPMRLYVDDKRANGKCYFIWTIHHALYDGWLGNLILRQVEQAYTDSDARISLAAYQPFVRLCTDLAVERTTAYWCSQLESCEATVFPSLPTPDYQPDADQSVAHHIAQVQWQSRDITPATTVRAAWAMLIARYTNTPDTIFGAVVTGRQAALPGVTHMAGPTIATVPVRVFIDPEMSVHDLLSQVQSQAMEMTEFEQTGLQRIRRFGRGLEHTSQFQTLMLVSSAETESIERSALFDCELHTTTGSGSPQRNPFVSTHALVISCRLEADALKLNLCFDSHLLDRSQAQRIVHQFEHLLRQLCVPSNATAIVASIPAASPADLHDIWSWNDTVPQSVDRCVHDMIADVVKIRPDAEAVCAWDGEWTYAQLDALSTRLACRLVSIGVRPGVFVPLYFEKSKWVPVAMLGVMKAGGASVALDASLPDDRLRSIVSQVEGPVILSSTTNLPRAEALYDTAEVLVPETLNEVWWTHLPVVQPSDLLFIIFTSGSTGTPKGITISHSNFCSYLTHQVAQVGISSRTRTFDFASYAFDVAWSNAIITFANGGCLCIPSQEERESHIGESITRYKANLVTLTPSVARSVNPAEVPGLECLIVGGEALRSEDVTQWRSLPLLINAYGPAECTVVSTLRKLVPNRPRDSNIGWSTGANAWVVEKDGNALAAVGSIGELWLEGPAVAQGYLDNPEKTAEAFIQDPLWLMRGGPSHVGRSGRLYRTGDVVRQCSDGSLDFIGRKDAQVKIRGQRVELDDIAYHVQNNIDAHCHVVAELITPSDREAAILAAFISPGADSDGATVTKIGNLVRTWVVGLDERLTAALPVYMVPTVYIPMFEIPRTATDKIDRRRLRAIGGSMTLRESAAWTTLAGPSRGPLTEIERKLQSLWASVLSIDSSLIETNSSFFKLGGDSISAIRLVGLAKKHRLHFKVADIFSHSQLSDLAGIAHYGEHTMETVAPFTLLRGEILPTAIREQAAERCHIDAGSVEDVYPCTPLQEGLLALSVKTPGAYLYQATCELHEHVDLTKFRTACDTLVATTPVLRTRIIELPGQNLVQVVTAAPARWIVDSAAILEPMNLGTALVSFELDEDVRSFTWTIHHAVFDGWSLPLLLQQIESIYTQRATEAIASFQPFIKHILDMDDARVRSYWQCQLGSSEATCFPELPSKAYQPKADQTLKVNMSCLQWPRIENCTASAVIRAAWSILITRYSDARDATFGVVVSGRQAPVSDVERIAGPTIATVPIRIRIDREQSVGALLQQVQKQATEMIDFEQTGLSRIRRISTDMEQASEFQSLVVVQPPRVDSQHSCLYKTTPVDDNGVINTFNAYALLLLCELQSDGDVHLTLSYDSKTIQHQWAMRVMQHLEHIIRQLCEPGYKSCKFSEVEWTSPQDLAHIWNQNAVVPSSIESCVHDLFAVQVHDRPNAQAICAWDGELTYTELDALSTRLAHHLAGLGVGPEVIVPLLFEKSKWAPVAMLGVMKAGGASVAMDVTHPDEHIQNVVERVHGSIIVTSSASAMRARTILDAVVVVEPEQLMPKASSLTARLPTVHHSNTLYVVFTSGSTGTPKGVVISHANFSSAVLHQSEALGHGATARLYNFASYAFDAAWSDNLRALVVGACVCIPSQHERQNAIASSICRLRADWASLTPSVARSLNPADVPGLQHLVFGGEVLLAEDVRRWKSVPRLLNCYGPTECTVLSTVCEVNKNGTANPDIGRSAGLNAWIVDSSDVASLVPVGAIGELILEGPLVGQGYLADPQSTAASFIEDPPWLLRGSSSISGRRGRLYCTGDLVRHNVDGALELLGRRDAQVKIRGQRVELGDVEHHLRGSLSDTIECQVVCDVIRPRGSSSPILAAFVSLDKAETQTEEEHGAAVASLLTGLDEKLAKRLPAYMIPTVYIPVQRLPVTVNGKTDRRQLLKFGASATVKQFGAMTIAKAPGRKPTTEIEVQLRHIWAAVLGIDEENIGLDDSFFAIGGDSITAMRLSILAQEGGLALKVADVFEHSRLHELAASAERAIDVYTEPGPFSLVNAGINLERYLRDEICSFLLNTSADIEDVLPINDTQRMCLESGDTASLRDCYHFFVDLPVGSDVARLARSCQMLCDAVDILRTVFVPSRGDFVQVVLRNFVPAIDVIPVQGDMGAACQQLYDDDLQASLPLGSSFVRFIITYNSQDSVRVTIRMSHAQYDGMSLAPLLSCWTACYEHQQPLRTPRFVGWVSHALRREEAAVRYWRTVLQGSNLTCVKPPADACPSDTIFLRKTFPAPSVQDCTSLAALFTSACVVSVSKATVERDVTIGLNVSGRSMLPSSLLGVIGPCVSYIPVRCQLDEGATSLNAALPAVRAQMTSAKRFETTGFKIFKQCAERWPAEADKFGVFVNFLNHEHPAGQASFGKLDIYQRMEYFTTPQVWIVCMPYLDRWELLIKFNRHFHDESTVAGIMDDLVTILS